MNTKLKLGIISLLGFSTACSTAKHATSSKEAEEPTVQVDSTQQERRVRVMYGVRPPKQIYQVQAEQGNTPSENTETPKAE